jgi:hypothetical protein
LKNYAIVESGSSKADWAIIVNNEEHLFTTRGINPITKSGLDQKLEVSIIQKMKDIEVVFFYGAGANNDQAYERLVSFFELNFGKKISLKIESDLMAAVKASLGRGAGIVAILGTGSNAAIFEDGNIIAQIPSLGYIVSDEGSGNHIGKILLKKYFSNQLSLEDKLLFETSFDLNRNHILEQLYGVNSPAAYLATFAKYLSKCSKQLKQNVLGIAFNEFIEIRIKSLPNFSKFDLHFVGSIADVFQEELQHVLTHHDLILKSVIDKPMNKLIEYHKNNL